MSSNRIVWLASYPKSGNTWLRVMLSSLLRDGGETDINAINLGIPIASHTDLEWHFGLEASDLLPDEIAAVRPELYRAIAATSSDERIFIKTHDQCWRNAAGERIFPPEVSRAAIYVVRDPRDVAPSAAHFFDCSLDYTIKTMADTTVTIQSGRKRLALQLPQFLGSWSSHALSWLDDAAMPVLLVRYEDMLADPVGKLEEVATFLGLPTVHVATAVEGASFSRLQSQEAAHGFRERPDENRIFFRHGRSGEGRRTLTPEQITRVERDHGEVMARLGYL